MSAVAAAIHEEDRRIMGEALAAGWGAGDDELTKKASQGLTPYFLGHPGGTIAERIGNLRGFDGYLSANTLPASI